MARDLSSRRPTLARYGQVELHQSSHTPTNTPQKINERHDTSGPGEGPARSRRDGPWLPDLAPSRALKVQLVVSIGNTLIYMQEKT